MFWDWLKKIMAWLTGKRETEVKRYYKVDLRKIVDTMLPDGTKLYIVQIFVSGGDVMAVYSQPMDRILDLHLRIKEIGMENLKESMDFFVDDEQFNVIQILKGETRTVVFVRDFALEEVYGL